MNFKDIRELRKSPGVASEIRSKSILLSDSLSTTKQYSLPIVCNFVTYVFRLYDTHIRTGPAKANGINTYSYLRFLFERMPAAKIAEEYEQLLLWNFKKVFIISRRLLNKDFRNSLENMSM
ncbi:MAG: transposase domain-containing protein [Oligoflexales bacterium]|nr:transposase domain-containing protein [Oligoflexales bacterium]